MLGEQLGCNFVPDEAQHRHHGRLGSQQIVLSAAGPVQAEHGVQIVGGERRARSDSEKRKFEYEKVERVFFVGAPPPHSRKGDIMFNCSRFALGSLDA